MAEKTDELGLCTSYLWSKDKGHIALQADGGPYISFWPTRRRKGLESVPAKWYPSLYAEIKKKGPPDATYYITDMNINKIKIWWEKFTENDPDWHVLTQSCSNVVYKALGEGSDRFKRRVEGFVTTPKAVAKLIEYDMEDKKAKIRLGSCCKPCSK